MSSILPQKERKKEKIQPNSDYDTSGRNVFVHFLEELRIPKKTFEITVVCKIVHKFASVWCKTALGKVGVSLP